MAPPFTTPSASDKATMHTTKKVLKASAQKFHDAVEVAAEALDELISYGYEDVFEDIAEELLDEAEDADKGSARQAWLEQVAAFALLQAYKIDLVEDDAADD